MGSRLNVALPIAGVQLVPLREFRDARGVVLHMLREDSPFFRRFGEVYFSEINPGVVKGWKRHRRMTQHLVVPSGRVKFALYDDRPDSKTRGRSAEYVLGRPDAYALLIVPPGVWYGFRGLGTVPSLIANCTDLPHDPGEAEQQMEYPGGEMYAW